MSSHKGWSVRERVPGTFQARAWDPKAKKYKTETYQDRLSAEKWAKQEHARLVLQQSTAERSRTSLRSVADEYLDDLKLHNASEEHMAQMRYVVAEAIAAGVTDLAANDIVRRTRIVLLGLKTKRKVDASDTTRNNFLKQLRTLGNFAATHGAIVRNPFKLLKFITVPETLKEVFSIDELRQLVDPKNADHSFYRPFCAMIYTGFRLREMTNMEWPWFMWDAQRIRLSFAKKARAVAGTSATTAWKTKSRRERITRLASEFAAIMKPAPGETPTGLVFPDLKPMGTRPLQARFDSFLRHSGLEVKGRTPHSCRHTWTCLMLASGENEILVQQYAGHSQKEMTAHYAQSQEEFRVQVAREGWARGELSLMAPPVEATPKAKPAKSVAATEPIPGPGSAVAIAQ